MLRLRFPLPVFRNAKEIANGVNARMALKGLVANKVSLIVSKSFTHSQFYNQVLRLINAETVDVVTKSWDSEPSKSDLTDMIQRLEKFQPDLIIALGGGSVIDGAKCAWLFYESPEINDDILYRPFALPPLRGRSKFVALPTTIGSGSEVSSAAILLDRESGSKRAVVTHDFLPDLVILDPELVTEVPVPTLLTTIADALSHAVEGYVSKVDHLLMDSFAEKAVSIIVKKWESITANEMSIESVMELQYAAMMAGWVQNHCVVGLSHAIAHQLGQFGIAHGLANGILMPEVIRYNMKDEKCAGLYSKLLENAAVENGLEGLIELFTNIVSEATLKVEVDITSKSIDALSEQALLDPAARTNPREFSAADVKEILRKCL